MASIIIASGPQRGEFLPLGNRTNVIGRDPGLFLQVVDPEVSRRHFKIRFDTDSNKHYAIDMESKHGVLINGVRIVGGTELADGDKIRIGRTMLLFTARDFPDEESALSHLKKADELGKETIG